MTDKVISDMIEAVTTTVNFKKLSLIVIFVNLSFSIFILLLWFTGTETFSGGICEYWRCIDMRIMLIPPVIFCQIIINLYYLISYGGK